MIVSFQLVGHVIKGGGIAITGQEQRQPGGGFLEGEEAPPGEKLFKLKIFQTLIFKIFKFKLNV